MDYQVRLEELDASDYGSCQRRKRVFLFVAKIHMRLPFAPTPMHGVQGNGLLPPPTVEHVIGWYANKLSTSEYIPVNANGIVDFNHHASNRHFDDGYDKLD